MQRRFMVLTPSTMLPLGSGLPDFVLPVANGSGSTGILDSTQLPRMPVVLMLLCSHCPFVKHIEGELTRIDRDYSNDVSLLGIASNSWITHPQDGPESLLAQARRHGWRFPYLLDQEQSLAKALRAACTPESTCSPLKTKGVRAWCIGDVWMPVDLAAPTPPWTAGN